MKTIMNIIFYIGFLFFGGGFLLAFSQFILYNGFGDVFEYKKADNVRFDYDVTFSKKIEITNIYYQYVVNDELYISKESIATKSIQTRGIQTDEVYYNRVFPALSYVGNNMLSLRKAKTGMVIMSIPFLLILSIYLFADMDKWIRIYTKGEYKSSKP